MPAEQREIFPEAAGNRKRNPGYILVWRREFGNHHQRDLRKDVPQVFDGGGNQVLGPGSEKDLNSFAQINTWRRASNALFLRSSHCVRACTANAVETGFTNGSAGAALRPHRNPPPTRVLHESS